MNLTLGYYSDITQRTPSEGIDYAVLAEKKGSTPFGLEIISILGSTQARSAVLPGFG